MKPRLSLFGCLLLWDQKGKRELIFSYPYPSSTPSLLVLVRWLLHHHTRGTGALPCLHVDAFLSLSRSRHALVAKTDQDRANVIIVSDGCKTGSRVWAAGTKDWIDWPGLGWGFDLCVSGVHEYTNTQQCPGEGNTDRDRGYPNADK